MSARESCSKRQLYIDTTNTTTLRYLQEIEDATGRRSTNLNKRSKKYEKDKGEAGYPEHCVI